MDVKIDDWKKNVGFPINYDSGQSSDDDFDTKDVVMRNPRHSSRYMLADGGDGAEADLLGTTPPRSRIRDKAKRRNFIDSGASLQKPIKEKKDVVDYAAPSPDPAVSERLRKRSSLKLIRSKERDYKLDVSQHKADSLPSPNPTPAVPTLVTPVNHYVESCSRFMSLSSRPKCRLLCEERPAVETPRGAELPASRVNFHKTFSMLINMGNMEKGCRRTISREEQVWQNELKDLIWLELQAKIAGRTLPQQDAYLCAQRKIVPTVVENILQYRFENPNPCPRIAKRPEQVSEHTDAANATVFEDDEDVERLGCLTLDCEWCSSAVGRALREVGATLDAFYNVTALYPSTQAMTHDHPTIATALFNDRLKAMCLWYNTALHLRLKMIAVRLVLRSINNPRRREQRARRPSIDSDVSRQSSEGCRAGAVRFNLEQHTPSSTNSDERADDDDSGLDSMRHTGQTTPEIVVDSAYSTSEEPGEAPADTDTDPFDIGSLEELTVMRLLNKCHVSMYREHHQEILKTQGVRRSMMFMNKMRENVLQKVHLTLEIPHNTIAESEVEEPVEVFRDPKDEEEPTSDAQDDSRTEELRRYGCWSLECRSMRLPSYRAHFLLLSAICMEAVHDYLAFRLDTRPERPSCLTVKQLMHELKEGLDIASEMRVNFIRNLRTALGGRGAGAAAADLLLLVRTFDTTVTTMLQVYLSYLTTMSEKEAMPRGALQAEWRFTARLARRIKCAHHLAPTTFSRIVCNQLKRLLKSYNDKFDQLGEHPHHNDTTRHGVYAICRAAQNIFASEREHTLQAAQWARALAARLARAPPPAYLKERQEIFSCLMAVRDYIVQQVRVILAQSRPAFAEEGARDVPEPVLARVRELLLQTCKLAFELHKELYKFACDPLYAREDTGRTRPASLQPPPPARRAVPRRRPETVLVHESFNVALGGIHKELHGFAQESSNRPGVASRRSLASPSRPPRGKFVRSDSVIEDYDTTMLEDRFFDNITQGENQTQNSIELLLLGYTSARDETLTEGVDEVDLRRGNAVSPASEEEVELRVGEAPCVEKEWAARVARAVIEFAQCWMSFVLERCDKGRGLRPRWASQGLEFLMLACDPCNTRHLSEEEFEELKQLMDGCISHVIGCRRGAEVGATPSPRARHRLHSPFSSSTSREGVSPPAPPSPQRDEPPLSFNGPDTNGHSQRVMEAISKLEAAREATLVENKSVGRVVTAHVSYEMKLKQLSFKWQRGLKIGAGTFGKVYTVVNTESGQLLAMKELSIGASDRRAFQRAANELRVLEGVIHPHLVRYYGAELHREEMLIFMELCVEGSLEALVATSGALAEHTVRRYTRQLLSAVLALHARSIAHRDIKSGNIFLTNEGHCLKLGDFGCAVKIRANTTAPNELQGFVGTQAYMAPEVFMKSSGHGRAADIWSVGCVVTEMASGKRPFSEYDSNYQIMFRVGMGARPHIAPALSEEGRTFCEACLTHEPAHRPRAQDLMLHSFLLVNSDDDDCKCEPAYLITK